MARRLTLAKAVFCAILATQNASAFFFLFGPIVYRLGHQVFILVRGVRLPLGLPNEKNTSVRLVFSFSDTFRFESVVSADFAVEEGGFSDDAFLIFIVNADQTKAGPESFVPFEVIEQ